MNIAKASSTIAKKVDHIPTYTTAGKKVAPIKPTDTQHRELSWLSQRIERGRKETFTEIVSVTPEIAKRLLELNPDNRKLNQKHVADIANDIKNGYWQMNGETIIVSKDGLLNNGQHRLEAIIAADMPAPIIMVFGVDRESRLTVDMGKTRSAAGFLGMIGVKNATTVAGTSRALLMYKEGSGYSDSGRVQPTKQQIRAYADDHAKELDLAAKLVSGSKFFTASGPTAFAAAYIILRRLNAVEAEVFFARLNDGANLSLGDPALMLRAKFQGDWKHKRNVLPRLEIVLRYWNAWRKGVKLSRHLQVEGSFPKLIK